MTTGDAVRRRPNVLYIQSDQHNASVTGCYGDAVVRTPNLDGLAARGVVMDAAYCASPICVPSRMSLITGRYPYENEVWTNDHILDSAIPTYAHSMGAAGYRPVQIGRMHFNGPDQLHGFAERLVGDHSPNYIGSPRPVDHGALEGTAGPARVALEKSGYGQSAYQVHDEYVTAATVDYLNRLGVRKRSGQEVEPFSLSVGLMLPHQPFVARKEDYDLYAGSVTMPRTPEPFSEDLHPYFQWWRRRTGIEEVDEETIMRCRTAYWALVARMDAMIGEMLEALRSNGLSEEHPRHLHDRPRRAGRRAWSVVEADLLRGLGPRAGGPVLAGVLPQGVHCDRVINQLDLNATMLDAVGAPALPRSHGRSLIKLLTDPDNTPWDDVAFSEYCMDAGARWSVRRARGTGRLAPPDGPARPLEAELLPRDGAAALQPRG